MNITVHHAPSFAKLSMTIFTAAGEVALQDNQVNSPDAFRRKIINHPRLAEEAAEALGYGFTRIVRDVEVVLFGCKFGVDEHTDKLSSEEYGDLTLVVPAILPKRGRAILRVGASEINVVPGIGYRFDHRTPHSLKLDDVRTGCALLMISELKR